MDFLASQEYCYNDINHLITKLRELTAPLPKYKYALGQTLWYVDSRQNIQSAFVEYIDDEGRYVNGSWHLPEDAAYPSKEALIEAQIDYWDFQKRQESFCQRFGIDGLPMDSCRKSEEKSTHSDEKIRCPDCKSEVKLMENQHFYYCPNCPHVWPKFEGEVQGFDHFAFSHDMVCEHEYQKTLAKSGMFFISMCHKCHDEQPWRECEHETISKIRPYKCKKCGEFYR